MTQSWPNGTIVFDMILPAPDLQRFSGEKWLGVTSSATHTSVAGQSSSGHKVLIEVLASSCSERHPASAKRAFEPRVWALFSVILPFLLNRHHDLHSRHHL